MQLSRVQFLSLEHLLPIILALFLSIVLIKYAKNKPIKIQNRLVHYLAVSIAIVMIAFHGYKILKGNYSLTTDLPLFLCSFLALTSPIFTYYRKFWMFEILVFWIIAGTIQGVITPDIEVGFPSFDYFRYWMVHLGLLTIIAYAITIFKMKPNFKSVFISFGVFQVYLILMFIINKLLNANYGYVNKKPEVASVLDALGDWPIYVIKADVLFLGGFFLIYFCFYVTKKRVS